MAATMQWVYQSTPTVNNSSVTVAEAIVTGDVYVAIDIGNYAATSEHGTSISGLGATWTKVTTATNDQSEVWVGLGGSNLAGGQVLTVTGPTLTGSVRRAMIVYCFRGVTTSVSAAIATGSSTTLTTAALPAAADQVAIAFGYSDLAANALKTLVPGSGWAAITTLLLNTGRYTGWSYRIASTSASHTAQSSRTTGLTNVNMIILGSLPPLTSTFVGWGNPIF